MEADPVHPLLVAQARADPDAGWFFSAVLDAFAYLLDELEWSVLRIHQHFRGDVVTLASDAWQLTIDHDPDDTGHVGATLWWREDLRQPGPPATWSPRVIGVNDLLRIRAPELRLPEPLAHRAPSQVVDAIETWAIGLRQFAPDVLRGGWPADLAGSLG